MKYSLLWAKTSHSDPLIYHSLLFHSLDTAAVALELIKARISRGKMRLWKDSFPSISEEQSIKLLALISALHDIGKATPHFQSKNTLIKDNLVEAGYQFSFIPDKFSIRHNSFSQMILFKELIDITGFLFEAEALERITKAIGGHHGEFTSAEKLNKITERVLGRDEWTASRKYIYETLYGLLEIEKPEKPLSISAPIRPLALQYWLTGFITFADWIASIEDYFPYECEIGKITDFEPEEYFDISKTRAVKALDGIGFPAIHDPGPLPEFSRLFNGYKARVQQNEILDRLNETNLRKAPFLMIVEAPMGLGKTEIAFAASEMINSARGQTGTYIAMPTQATSNQMYLRYKDFMERRLPAEYHTGFGLLHSASELFLSGQNTEFLPKEISNEGNGQTKAELEAHAWFKSKKRGLLAPFSVGTVDQALITVLRTKHNYLRLFGLNSKTIIFDEVHSYDVYMSTVFQRLLEWAGRFDISIIMLSATLPQNKRSALIEAYTGNKSNDHVSYPRMIMASEENTFSVSLTPPLTKKIVLSEMRFDDRNSIIQYLKSKMIKGGCIGIICNTVAKAQQLYNAFVTSSEFKNIPALLLHSRFPADIRNEIERNVISYFGKSGNRPSSMVLFSTQIIEQSLDLDFDYLISDLCPIDLFLQRIGRLFRFIDTLRPECFSQPEITWMSQGSEFFQSGSKQSDPYSKYVMYKTQLSLQPVRYISIPEDIEPLIEGVYGDENLENLTEDEIEILSHLRNDFIAENEIAEGKAERKLIPKPYSINEEFLDDMLFLDEEDPAFHSDIQAATRLGRPSVRAVCIEEKEGKEFLINNKRDPFAADVRLSDSFIQSVLGAVVPLSGSFICKALLNSNETKPPKSWERYPALRYLRVLKFKDGCCDCGAIKINYDSRLGIYYGNNLNPEEK